MLSLLLQIFVPYRRYVRVLKWLTLVLLAYVGMVFAVHIPWSHVLRETCVATVDVAQRVR